MSFTYLPGLSNDTSRIRVTIGDTTEGAGIRPGQANFSDEELAGLVTLHGNWQAAAIAAVNAARAQWASKASSINLGDYGETRRQVENLTQLARELTTSLPGQWLGMGLGSSSAGNPAVVK
jgi:hypothetical protein